MPRVDRAVKLVSRLMATVTNTSAQVLVVIVILVMVHWSLRTNRSCLRVMGASGMNRLGSRAERIDVLLVGRSLLALPSGARRGHVSDQSTQIQLWREFSRVRVIRLDGCMAVVSRGMTLLAILLRRMKVLMTIVVIAAVLIIALVTMMIMVVGWVLIVMVVSDLIRSSVVRDSNGMLAMRVASHLIVQVFIPPAQDLVGLVRLLLVQFRSTSDVFEQCSQVEVGVSDRNIRPLGSNKSIGGVSGTRTVRRVRCVGLMRGMLFVLSTSR